MPEPAAVRQALSDFLGDAQFRKFVQRGVRRGRLQYWQEEAWNRFITAKPEMRIGLDELASVLRICELHGNELLSGTAAVVDCCIEYAPEYFAARTQLFPHAPLRIVSTEGAPYSRGRVEIGYCPECRDAEAEWMRRHQPNG
jgi:hypothetical protein